MPVVEPEKPWSPYPVGHRDLKPSNVLRHVAKCEGRDCGWEGPASDLLDRLQDGRKACPHCGSTLIATTTTVGKAVCSVCDDTHRMQLGDREVLGPLVIEVRTARGTDSPHCGACERDPRPTVLVVTIAGRSRCPHDTDGDGNCPVHEFGCPSGPSGFTSTLCAEHSRDMLNGLAAMYCSATGESIRKVLGFDPSPSSRARMRR